MSISKVNSGLLLRARQCPECFMYINFNSARQRGSHYYFHFANEKVDTERLSNLFKATQLISNCHLDSRLNRCYSNKQFSILETYCCKRLISYSQCLTHVESPGAFYKVVTWPPRCQLKEAGAVSKEASWQIEL